MSQLAFEIAMRAAGRGDLVTNARNEFATGQPQTLAILLRSSEVLPQNGVVRGAFLLELGQGSLDELQGPQAIEFLIVPRRRGDLWQFVQRQLATSSMAIDHHPCRDGQEQTAEPTLFRVCTGQHFSFEQTQKDLLSNVFCISGYETLAPGELTDHRAVAICKPLQRGIVPASRTANRRPHGCGKHGTIVDHAAIEGKR